MGNLDRYKINLKNLKEDHLTLEFQLSDDFFKELETQEITGGTLTSQLEIRQSSGNYLFCFQTKGTVSVICDRCLDDMILPVDTTNHLTAKFGPEASDEGDEVVTVSEEDGIIDVSWYIYEFIMLSLPIQRIHEAGKCDEQMISQLGKHVVVEENEADEPASQETDPRWNELKKIINNN